MLRRQILLLTLLASLLSACAPQPKDHAGGQIDPALWQSFKQLFVQEQGRVVDVGNGNISHSEGQGYAMLLAVAANDPASFELMWAWTRSNLSRQDDALLAWRWQPDVSPLVQDINNASDGDILIAWALARAAHRWNIHRYREEAKTLAASVREKLTRKSPHGTLLLPGIHGFEHPPGVTLNLSYWIFPAFSALDAIDPAPEWRALHASGLKLIRLARFGAQKLPSDWLLATPEGELRPALSHPARFGFDALRIPLYACWGRVDEPALYAAVAAQWSANDSPAWIDLNSGESAPYPLNSGAIAVRQLIQRCASPPDNTAFAPAPLPADNYYASVLILLSQLAQNELMAQ